MYRILKEDYAFVATENMEDCRREQGWELSGSFPYEINAVEGGKAYQTALYLAKDSEAVIIGSAPETFLEERLRNRPEGITFRYSERIYKRGKWRFLSPRGLLKDAGACFRHRRRRLYLLCASAYAPGDFLLHGFYLGKCYQWGYFPATLRYDPAELMSKKTEGRAKLLWCGRFIGWKHPEAAILLAYRLKREGFDFILCMIGSGEREDRIKAMIGGYGLEACVKLAGAMSPEQVRSYMEEADIFLFTSDFQEGWGAVVNEAMNSGCAVVASHAAGCVPYLIRDGVNGFIYKNGSGGSLYDKVRTLLLDRGLCRSLGRRAYETIATQWNAETAAERLLLLIDDLNRSGGSDRFQSGPCSRAKIIGNHWYRDKRTK